MRHLRLGVALAALVVPAIVSAQETSSAIRGTIIDEQNKPIAGATVTIIHTPSGTRLVQTSGANGEFNATGLRLGGPYSVTVEAPGFDPATDTLDGLTAGVPQRIEVMLAAQGKTITVTASRSRSGIRLASGPATVLTAADIKGIAATTRDIRNLAARDPLVSIDPSAQDGAISISIAGQNNRFNRITVDGVSFGDPFGLESGGLASARGPVPLDAIAEFSVETAPVDVQQGFFQGGAINTQLKSGTNEFHATGFVTYQDNRLRGTRTGTQRVTAPFESQNYGLQVTGPIIKDKLFFAVTWERLRDTRPINVTAASLGIPAATISQVDTTLNGARYKFDPLEDPQGVPEKDDKVVAKLDWNIADGHRAAITYIYNKGDIAAGATPDDQASATNPTLRLLSNLYSQGSINHFGVFQLNDQWSDSFSTQLRVSYQDYVRLQEPYNGRSFGQFTVCLAPNATTGTGSPICPAGTRQLRLGPDGPRHANELSSSAINVEFQAQLKLNNHTFKFIAERRDQDVNNLFGNNVSGSFRFDSIADLDAGRANQLSLNVPVLGGVDTIRALFNNTTWTFGLQDTWDATSDLSLTAGVRYDVFETGDAPLFNQAFFNRYGFANNATLNKRHLLQPRLGMNWRVTDRVRLRGSAGLFGGGTPLVWISNNYSNPGPNQQTLTINRLANGTFQLQGIPLQSATNPNGPTAAQVQTLGAAALNNVTGGPGIPADLFTLARNNPPVAALTNALDPEFRVPSQWRISGSVDVRADLGFLGDDWNLGADVIWSRVKDGLEYRDLRLNPNGTLPDGRQRWVVRDASLGGNPDLLLTNTDKGYSWNIVARFDKRWTNGFRVGGSYTFQRARDVQSGTSSIALSNVSNAASGINPNAAAYGISNYQTDNAYRLVVSYDHKLFGDNNTRIELFFNSRAGQRFSYTMNDGTMGNTNNGAVFGTLGNNNRNLLYVPNVASRTADTRVTYNMTDAQFAQFQALVLGSPLEKYQGGIAPKNIGQSGRFNKLDLSIRQEVPFVFGGKIELFADMENVLNFINPNWGQVNRIGFPGYASVVSVACAPTNAITSPCTQYVYSSPRNPTDTRIVTPSLWQLRLGARLSF